MAKAMAVLRLGSDANFQFITELHSRATFRLRKQRAVSLAAVSGTVLHDLTGEVQTFRQSASPMIHQCLLVHSVGTKPVYRHSTG